MNITETISTNLNAETIQMNTSNAKGLRVRSSVKAGGWELNHSEGKGLRVRTSVKAGTGNGGIWLNHSEAAPQRLGAR